MSDIKPDLRFSHNLPVHGKTPKNQRIFKHLGKPTIDPRRITEVVKSDREQFPDTGALPGLRIDKINKPLAAKPTSLQRGNNFVVPS